ncbi:uncharacterized protein LOC112171021 [Rosa chinensis]|uniref:uncharacterized protein LOC112171021 n=1 Tax=Rosa chinensis TaxID=74649 RepID=UPI000D08671F|nr:uncharacterized protein LOC112171021 [Rosa chinensis]
MDSLPMQHLVIFIMLLLAIWCERNNLVWIEDDCNLFHMSTWALQLLEDYQKVHPKLVHKVNRPKTKWFCPPSGRLKLNIDGAYLADSGKGRIGVVVRDETGVCVAAFARHVPYALSALHMEVEAIRASLLIAIDQGWTAIEVESDCVIALNALTDEKNDVSGFSFYSSQAYL